jgi:hypothetical protein
MVPMPDGPAILGRRGTSADTVACYEHTQRGDQIGEAGGGSIKENGAAT